MQGSSRLFPRKGAKTQSEFSDRFVIYHLREARRKVGRLGNNFAPLRLCEENSSGI